MSEAREGRNDDIEIMRRVLAEAAWDAAAANADPDFDGSAAATEELVGYLRGELEAEDEARLQRSLVADPRAARALLDLADLEEAAAELETVGAAAREEASPRWPPVRWHWRGFAFGGLWNPALATLAVASLLVATVLGVRLAHVERQLTAGAGAEDGAVEVNLASLVLLPSGRGAEKPAVDEEPVAEVAPGGSLILRLGAERRCPVYRAVVEGAGRSVELPGLHRDERGLLSARLRLAPGRYALSLFGCAADELLHEHHFRVEAAPPPGGRAP